MLRNLRHRARTITFRTQFWMKMVPKMVRNPGLSGPSNLQNRFVRPPGRSGCKGSVSEGLGDTSRLRLRGRFGSPKSLQTRHGSTSKTQLNSKRLLEGFWDVSEVNFESFYEVADRWDDVLTVRERQSENL